jgi:flagellar hook assembly protein FlgD/outer membrane protein OmpA-like peptidoglycan-associated protein
MRRGSRAVLAAMVLFMACGAAASGESGFLDFSSPGLLSTAGAGASVDTPFGTLLNPSVSAGKQRVTLDFSWVPLLGFGAETGWGNVVNAGAVIPTRAGVLSLEGQLASAGFPSLGWGTLGGFAASFAKDLFPDLYVGAGIGFRFGGSAAAGGDWGLGLDLGFLHLPGDLGILKDFRWGGALRGLGKGYLAGSVPGALSWPPVFTPAVGAWFALVRTDPVVLSLSPDLSFPSFQDVRFSLAAQLSILNTVSFSGAYIFDFRQSLGAEPARSLPFAFGAAVTLKTDIKENITFLDFTERGWNRSEVRTTVAAAPLQNGIWGIGLGVNVPLGVVDRSPPDISIDTGADRYISPNFDGVKDDLVLAVSIKDERFVKGYRFVVLDVSGAAVRTILNKEDRPENRDFANLMARLVYVKTGIPIPDTLRWDGKTDDGTIAADGAYTYLLEAWDDNGNMGKSSSGTVLVKSSPPVITAAAPYLIFSPNGDGNKETLPVRQTGSREDEWAGIIRSITGAEVRHYAWKDSVPPDFEWDGKTDAGALAPDGVYSYRVSATDRAGNPAAAEIDNIIIDTQAAPVQLSIDLSYFSPNGDGVKDTVTLTPRVPAATGIESWSLVITDAAGSVRRGYSGRYEAPGAAAWDGRDDSGARLPEGTYRARLSLVYVNGHSPSAESPAMTIKLSPPAAAATADADVFSPTGDSQKSTVTIYQDTTEEVFWTGAFLDQADREVRSMVWRGRAEGKFVWDGRADDGTPIPDGVYRYVLTATDRAGNTGSSKPLRIRVDTQKKPVRVSTDVAVFSPFGGGTRTKIRIIPTLTTSSGIVSYSLKIKSAKGDTVRSYSGTNRAPEEVSWAGIDDTGKRVADGQYTAELAVSYTNGSQPRAVSSPFSVDNHFPQVDVSAPVMLFSPDGRGKLQSITISQSSSSEDLWEGEIRGGRDERVRGWFWKGKAADFTWDGKDENGNTVPDGYYTYTVKSQTAAGNAAAKELRGIQVDTRPTPVYATQSAAGFSPNGDGVMDTEGFSIILGLKEGVRGWKLLIQGAKGQTVKEFGGPAPVPASVVWDGKDRTGYANAPDGMYTAVLQVDYYKGNLAEARTAAFLLDTTPPRVQIGLSPLPFSPDNDGVNDELTIGLKVDSASPVESWAFQILDPAGHPFAAFSGKGAPAEKIIWNGVGDGGELVQAAEDYPLIFTIKDSLGNSGVTRTVIPVDVLVVKDGDRLKVRIASITFAANAADYANVEADKAEKNSQTIKRLAEIFKKYSQYKITILGHANLVNFDDPARAKREQEQELIPLSKARAEAIKAALAAEGIDPGRVSTVGTGAAEPLVPFSDMDNRWKNRRVEFILVRQ